jgi:hypothetical protein
MNSRSFSTVLAAMGLFLLLCGCQTMLAGSVTGSVSPEDLVAFPQGQSSGAWKGNYLVVDYRYSRNQSDLDMTGKVEFLDNMSMNFVFLRDFQLSAIFIDENGRVLATKSLVTGRGNFDPIPFRTQIGIPPTTVSIAFSYQGTAIEGGTEDGGGITRFFQYPIH